MIEDRANSAAQHRNYTEQHIRRLQNTGLQGEDWLQILPGGLGSTTLLKAAASAATALSKERITPDLAIRAINHIVATRLSTHARGGSRVVGPATTDYQRLSKLKGDAIRGTRTYTDSELSVFGLVRGEHGLVKPKPGVPEIEFSIQGAGQTQRALLETEQGQQPEPYGQAEASSSKRQRSPTPESERQPDAPQEHIESQPEPPEGGAGERALRKRPRVDYGNRSEQGSSGGSQEPAPSANESSTYEPEPEAEPRAGDTAECKCDRAVDEAFKKKISKQEKSNVVLSTELKRLALAAELKAICDKGLHICHRHIKATATAIGMRSRETSAELTRRICIYADSRTTVGTLKTGDDTYFWFTQAVRELHPAEIRGVFKYDTISSAAPTLFTPNIDAILAYTKSEYKVDMLQDFTQIGNVHIPAFRWWFTTTVGKLDGADVTIADLAKMEFDIYMWHFRKEIGNSGSLGWLRNMYYSGIQQIMRMDPEYYRCYVALRPDHYWRLISYPYYAKYSIEGDKTFFRHIDINITQYLKDGRGGNMIQGSVSLDDEKPDMCTEIIPGMHTKEKIESWYNRVKARHLAGESVLDAYVSRVQDKKIWSPEDAKHFDTDFTPFPCKAGDIRITSPLLPHGSTAMPKGGIRRTMLPWFVGIQDNHIDMETIEMGSWVEIADAHRALTAAPRSPSGKPNVYGGIPYRFPASMPVHIKSPLSNALIGRTRWDMPDVELERDLVLGSDNTKYKKWLHDWREDAGRAYFQHFLMARNIEIKLYGYKSF